MRSVNKRAVALFSMAASLATLLISGCATTTGSGSGCASYAEARLAMPQETLADNAWGRWVADTDDRMTGTCR